MNWPTKTQNQSFSRKVTIDAGAIDLTNNRPIRDKRGVRATSSGMRQDQADTSKKLIDPDEDEQVLRHRGKPRHFMERLVRQGRLVT